jgi:hypothetical protein
MWQASNGTLATPCAHICWRKTTFATGWRGRRGVRGIELVAADLFAIGDHRALACYGEPKEYAGSYLPTVQASVKGQGKWRKPSQGLLPPARHRLAEWQSELCHGDALGRQRKLAAERNR